MARPCLAKPPRAVEGPPGAGLARSSASSEAAAAGEVNPAGAELGERDGLVTGLAQSLEQPLCWASAGVVDRLSLSSEIGGRLERSGVALLGLDV